MKAIVTFAVVCSLLTGCPLDQDPGFDDWCGNTLCKWQLQQGAIQKAPTWHERDYGVDLLGSNVVLAQVSDTSSVTCLEFSVIANIDPAASVYLEMDFLSDGTIDYRQRIPSAKWDLLSFLVSAPTWYDGVTFFITKESAGQAVLARLDVSPATGCTAPPIPLGNRPAGAWCESNDQCASDVCNGATNVCKTTFAVCNADADCTAGTGPCVPWPATCQ
jgi:hypothetical protein